MSYSSLDPEGYPGTPEFQDWEEERSRRAWHERLAYMEEVDEMNLMFPYNWTIAPSTGALFLYVQYLKKHEHHSRKLLG